MLGKQEIRKFLDEKGIEYEWIEHEAVYTIEDMARLGLEDMQDIAKNLFLRDAKGKRHFLVVVREDKKVDLRRLEEIIGSKRLSFASEERLEKYLGLKKGSVTPLGILNDEERAVEVFFDADFCEMGKIGVHPNENTASVYLSTESLLQVIREHGNPLEIIAFA